MNAPDAPVNLDAQPLQYQGLVRVLEEELRLYRVLGEALTRKRDALVKLDRARVDALCKELDVLIYEIRRVAEARLGLVRSAAKGLGRRGESLKDLAETAPEPYRTRFAGLRRDMLSQVQTMERQATLCRDLVGDSLVQVHAFVRLLAGLGGPPPVYANPRATASAGLVDRQA